MNHNETRHDSSSIGSIRCFNMKKKYIIFPRIQLKYASLLGFLTLLHGVVFIFLIVSVFDGQVLLSGTEHDISKLKSDVTFLGAGIAVFGSALVFASTILILHRFLGPIIAVNRSLQKFEETGIYEAIQTRKDDEMGKLVEKLNSVLGKNLK